MHSPDMPLCRRLLPRIRPFAQRCARHFAEGSRHASPSRLQRAVAAALRRAGTALDEEVVLADAGGYSVDLLLSGSRVVVEVDGPTHYVTGPRGYAAAGATRLKHQQLRAFGYRVVSVPFWEWQRLQSAPQQMAYLQRRGLVHGPPPQTWWGTVCEWLRSAL